jgi:hypothetical protein
MFGFGFACRELYCLKVVKLVFLLLVVNHVVDLMMCVILVLYNSCIVCLFWRLSVREAAKTDSSKKTDEYKKLYSSVSRDEYKSHTSAVDCLRGPIYSLVNRQIYGSTCQIRSPAPTPLYSSVSPTNVTEYIYRFHIIDE